MTLEIWILVIAVFAAVVLTRLGRHRYSRRQRLVTLGVIAVLVLKYVRGMPTTGHDALLEAVCAGIGVLFGLGMLASTAVERDESTGQVWVRAGVAYLVLWVVMLGSRIAFAYSATGFGRSEIGRFFATNHITGAAITPAFVLMTVGSLVVVTLGLALRAEMLPGGTVRPSDTNSAVGNSRAVRSSHPFGDRPSLLRDGVGIRARIGERLGR